MQGNVNTYKKKSRSIISRNYKDMDVEAFMSKIENKLNNIVGNDVNVLANEAVNIIVNCLDEVAPRRKIIMRDRWQGGQWFSEEIHETIKQRDHAHKRARLTKERADWEVF